MAITINNNLYPPIFYQSYMPAFIYTSSCKIYFSISQFNSIQELHETFPVQAIVQNQKSNQFALNKTKYPSGIKLSKINIDENREGADKYYIQISNSDIQGGFNINEYYKIQLRFTGAAAATPPSSGAGIDGWLSDNVNYFSEWSQVMLIYGISEPILSLKGFNTRGVTYFTSYEVPIVGKIVFSNESDKEILKSYHIYLYNQNKQLIEDSGQIYGNMYQSINQINYNLKYNLEVATPYILCIQITTKNLYTWSTPQSYNFIIKDNAQPTLDIDVQLSANNDLGYIRVFMQNKYFPQDTNRYTYTNGTTVIGKSLYLTLASLDSEENSDAEVYIQNENNGQGEQEQEEKKDYNAGDFKSALYVPLDDNEDTDTDESMILYNQQNMYHDMSKGSKFIVYRSSSKNNFTEWQHVDTITIKETDVSNITWYDYTVEPGIWYKYYIVKCLNTGIRVSSIKLQDKIMVVPDDVFLNANGKQLRIKYDPRVENFQMKVSQTLIETIGSKYPYIRRNGNIGYKTFSLSGTITAFMDLEQNLLQASKNQVYGESADLYEQYNKDNNITLYNDYIYERQFRKKVMDFLYSNDVKLFRSLTEGNILVKLMDISFTPNITLGRMIYSFSCTAYEIGDCTFSNYQKYNIALGKYDYSNQREGE